MVICAKCGYIQRSISDNWLPHDRKYPKCQRYGMPTEIDPVSGKEYYPPCYIKNMNGKCKDYKAKHDN